MVSSSSFENVFMFYGRVISRTDPFRIAHDLTKNEKAFFILYEYKLFIFIFLHRFILLIMLWYYVII